LGREGGGGIRPDQLEALLRNEPDLAFRWRVRSAFRYLDLQSDDRVLDCGCGLGFHLMALSKLGAGHSFGVDHDLTSLSFAQKHLSGHRLGLCLGDVYDLPYDDESFDKVLLIEMLEHLEDDLCGLREAWRVMKPGGTLAVSVPYRDYPFLFDPVNWMWERMTGHPIRNGLFAGIWTSHRRLYDREGLLELVRRVGFEVLECEMLTHYCLPFTHNLIYGIGKGLFLRRALPGFLLDEVDRFHPDAGKRRAWNPMTWLMRGVEWIDGLNSDVAGKSTFVNISVQARKPR